jgi:hypothetical protein
MIFQKDQKDKKYQKHLNLNQGSFYANPVHRRNEERVISSTKLLA